MKTYFVKKGLLRLPTMARIAITIALIAFMAQASCFGQASTVELYNGYGSDLLNYILASQDASATKEYFFAGLKSSRAKQIWDTCRCGRDRDLLHLIYSTRNWVPNNLTDDDLSFLSTSTKRLKSKGSAAMKRPGGNQIGILAAYTPQEVAHIFNVLTVPCFTYGDLPYGAPYTTWASWSLHGAYWDMGMAQLAKRSLVLRLLADQGSIEVPQGTSVNFVWSGKASIMIPLDPLPAWKKSDLRGLKNLLQNPYYGAMAQAKIDQIMAQFPPRR